ncbi:hypothetical protein GOODEAATRI_000181 [Goodea atripinnis]|uniref:Ig-like domain-containing protein n=1 Tax=Goodea atripinnis TaxID=208336 RepID=A0ABV0NJM6_9TELE
MTDGYVTLNLYNNGIRGIHNDAFNGTKIDKLVLKNNRNLEVIHRDAFQGATGPGLLDVSATALTKLPAHGLESVLVLSAQSAYGIKSLPPLKGLGSLREAHLTYNSHCCAILSWSTHRDFSVNHSWDNISTSCEEGNPSARFQRVTGGTADTPPLVGVPFFSEADLQDINFQDLDFHYPELDFCHSHPIICTPEADAFNPFQQSRANFHRRTRTSDPVVIPRHVSSVYLNKDQLRRLQFKPTIHSIELSEGHEAKFNCSIDIPDTRLDPSIVWKKNDEDLSSDDHVGINELQSITEGVTTLLSTVIIKAVQRVDAGEYCCTLSVNSEIRRSEPIVLKVEGLPAFTQQPEDLNVTRDTPFALTCMAEGPPEPVHIRWLHDGLHITDKVMSPYTLYVQGKPISTQSSLIYLSLSEFYEHLPLSAC